MTDEAVQVPLGTPKLEVRVIALHKGKEPGPFAYLQGMKSGLLTRVNRDPEKTQCAINYHKSEQFHFGMLANAVPCSSDAIVSPPSNRAWLIEPYRNAIAAVHQDAIDLTDAFSRQGDGRGGKGAPLNELLANLRYNPCGREKD
jgi:hypothetical protein